MTDRKPTSGAQLSRLLVKHGFELTPLLKLTEAEFAGICQDNPEWQIELDPTGKLIFMPPVHLDSGRFELEVGSALLQYGKQRHSGQAFGSSTGFKLPDGSIRAADAAWVSTMQLNRLTVKDRKSFARVVPEFVVEIRSDSDLLSKLKNKMTDIWMANGVQLAWLIDPVEQKAYVYRADGSIEVVTDFSAILGGENVLEGFEFNLALLKS